MAPGPAALPGGLAALPVGVLVSHAGEQVILQPGVDGAGLGVVLLAGFSDEAMRGALRLAFSSAVVFDAGLAISADGRHLLLSTWIPGVATWPAAHDALARLLDQCAAWRAQLLPAGSHTRPAGAPFDVAATRQRDRLLGLLHGKRI